MAKELCKDCDHLMVCKYTDSGDGRCQKPKYFRDKRQPDCVMRISPQTMAALNNMGRSVHAGEEKPKPKSKKKPAEGPKCVLCGMLIPPNTHRRRYCSAGPA